MNDSSKYVQKSVANHINDITKEDKELVFQWLQQLRDKQHPINPWIIKHGLRTVIKMVLYQKIFVLSILNKTAYASKMKYKRFSFEYRNNKRKKYFKFLLYIIILLTLLCYYFP